MIAALHLAYGMNKSQILWFHELVSHSPGIMHSLQGMLPLEDVPEIVNFTLPVHDMAINSNF
jgi:hypothetical protein